MSVINLQTTIQELFQQAYKEKTYFKCEKKRNNNLLYPGGVTFTTNIVYLFCSFSLIMPQNKFYSETGLIGRRGLTTHKILRCAKKTHYVRIEHVGTETLNPYVPFDLNIVTNLLFNDEPDIFYRVVENLSFSHDDNLSTVFVCDDKQIVPGTLKIANVTKVIDRFKKSD